MPIVSIIMPCYNAEGFLSKSIDSILRQRYLDWELIISNDGSTDNSKLVAQEYLTKDVRIQYVEKCNGGVASARNFGFRFISPESKYLIFYDADDVMHEEMLSVLVQEMESDSNLGAAYCDHVYIDENGLIKGKAGMPRYVATRFWYRCLADRVRNTPFISIFCWTQMFESLTLIRREAFEETKGWDESLGNIGEGVDLFSEIALRWRISFVNQTLYYYRRYDLQVTNVNIIKMKDQGQKLIAKWSSKYSESDANRQINQALIFYKYRLPAVRNWVSMKIHIKNGRILNAFSSGHSFIGNYIKSHPLMWGTLIV